MLRLISSLRVRALLTILFAIVPALTLFHYTSLEARNSEFNELKQETLELVRILSVLEKDTLDLIHQLLFTLSRSEEVTNFSAAECDQVLADMLSLYQGYLNFGVVNANGDVVCSGLHLATPVNLADRKYFRDVQNSLEFSIGEYQVGRITGKPSINFGYPLLNDNGVLTGVIYAAVDLAQFSRLEEIIASKIPEEAIFTMIDRNGIMLVQIPSGEDIIGNPFPEPQVLSETRKQNNGMVETMGTGGRRWVYSFATIDSDLYQNEIYLILAQPEEYLLAQANHVFNRNILIMVIVGIVLLIGTWFILDISFTRQTRSLLQVTQHLTRGDLQVRYPQSPFGTSEINRLGESINKMAASLQQREKDLLQAYDATIEGWSRAMDLRDEETEGHTLRVADLTVELAKAAGMSTAEIVHIRRGALLHDVGKLGIPDSILMKPGPLTEEEWVVMRQHPQYAFDMLSSIDYLRPALDIPYCHHERWDGAGYPRGLKEDEIPVAARLFAVVDVWDALCSDRPYRPAWPKDKALEYIRSMAGTQFDPWAVELFFSVIGKHG